MNASVNTWTFVAKVDDVPRGKKRCFNVADTSVIVCRIYDQVYVLKNLCPHRQQPLGDGRLIEYEITCPFHNASFDVRDGKVVSGPSVWPLETYQCKVDNGDIFFKSQEQSDKPQIVDPRLQV